LNKSVKIAIELIGEKEFEAEVKKDGEEILEEFPKSPDHTKYLEAGRALERSMNKKSYRKKIRGDSAETICRENRVDLTEENIKRVEKKMEEADRWSQIPWGINRRYNIRAFKIK
jgi:hypothetical protein